MARTTLLGSPLLLGFEHFERTLERIAKASADGFPPYNVEQIADSQLRLTLAVAGFALAELEITVEDGQLVIRGRQEEDPGRIFLHRGIAGRQFQRRFVLADGLEVKGATLAAGLLHIELSRPPAEAKVRKVRIADGSTSGADVLSIRQGSGGQGFGNRKGG
ncbi:MAG: Hsp20 family protein [Alphaproteobacteria bacterium]|nr:Hsp20 family protein [Alphaproteobacteria bacterium]